ncbi:hypothetical protein OS493_010925 [Desmophyllum pertusum]|uniref:Uncharacterized protein n=1 Tax=Desmophyllum pertusum TaxID=174260 RepID=A0A9W9ZEN7_9CNID|nr:hypothetical protein OS493_010925 [Desmophyllum pertusum]
MKKLLLVGLSFYGVLFAICIFPVAHGKSAQPVFKFDATTGKIELNRNFLTDIAKLPLPIRVIAMNGDSRVGKSTTLNVINHVWNGANRVHVEEIFSTGDSLATVARGVWAYITKADKEGSVVLLDVEAPDLGADLLVAHIHMFTAMISSGLNILDFEKLSGSDYLKAVETLATELKESPIKRTLEGSPVDGVALAELIERIAETINTESWLDFANNYHTIESNICKRSEAKFIAPLFKLKSEQIESEEKNILDAFAKECRLENGLTSAREKLQQIIQAKKSREEIEMIIAEYKSRIVEEVEKRAESEEEFQKIITDRDKVIAKETKAHNEAEQKAQNLMEKLNTCESRLKADIEKGWMHAAVRSAIPADIPGGAEFLYNRREKRKEADETNCNKMFGDEIKKLQENQKRIIDALESKYSVRELSEALIKVLSLCSEVMDLHFR